MQILTETKSPDKTQKSASVAQQKPKERRKQKKDWVTKAIPMLSLVGWLCVFFVLMLMDNARPRGEDFFSRFFDTPVYSSWNSKLLWIALVALVIVFVMCVVAFFFNFRRHRRKEDRYNKSILVLGLLTAAGIVSFLVRFGYYLF